MAVEENIEEEAEQCEEKVVHDYHDYANEVENVDTNRKDQRYPKEHTLPNHGEENFPVKLHYMLTDLETDRMDDIISWQPHGRSFLVHKQHQFVEQVLPLWFRQTKFPSFQRQLNLYGFKRLTSGRDKGAYYHELFLRSKRFLSHRIQRIKIKGKGARKPSSPETEPSFFSALYLPATIRPNGNPWIQSVGRILSSGPNMNLGMGSSLSLERLLANPASTASFQNQPAHLLAQNNITRLREFQAGAHLQQFPLLTLSARHDMQMLSSLQQQTIPMVYGRQDLSTTAMVAALSRPNPDPTTFAGLQGFWRGARG